jgi:uncharacterized protein
MDRKNFEDLSFDFREIENDKEYLDYISDLMDSKVVKSMKNYIQHGSTTTLDHCINVSYISYKIAKRLNLDAKSTARAGLLHDLFLYDWHKVEEKQPLFKKHGFTHPFVALKNARKYFLLNEIETDIIATHMWPLTFRHVPKHKESFVVTFVDKYCSTKETFEPLVCKIKNPKFEIKKNYLH